MILFFDNCYARCIRLLGEGEISNSFQLKSVKFVRKSFRGVKNGQKIGVRFSIVVIDARKRS
jgi:hypothetical protein